MSCPEELELFLLREGGQDLSPDRSKELADHLAGCAECQTRLAELQAVSDALARPDPLPVAEKAAFVAGVVKRIEAHQPTVVVPKGSRLWAFGLPAAIAAIAVGFGGVAVFVGTMTLSAGRDAESVAVAPTATQSAPYFGDDESVLRGRADGPTGRVAAAPPAPSMPGGPPPAPPAQVPAEMPAPSRDALGGGSLMGLGAADDSIGSGGSGTSAPAKRARGRGGDFAEEGEATRQAASAPGGFDQGIAPQPMAQAATTWTAPTMGPAAAPPRAIDPNGRFATTYRPGRGHMARFERQMLVGSAPEPVIALVADEGRGHGPLLEPPQDRALAIALTPGLTKLPPGGGPVHLAITLRSTTRAPTSRPKVAIHLVMDTSGSMSGQAIEQARQAALTLVGLLEPTDRFSLVSYSSDARLVVPDGPVGARRPAILAQIQSLQAAGGTNLEAGLRLGYQQAQASRSEEDQVQLVVVLSDGQPNQGLTDPWALSEMSAAAFQAEVETTSIGVGDSYEPQVMSMIAEHGAGGYYYLPDASTIEQVLRAELEVRTQPVARGVEVRVRLGAGVELLQAYGSRRLNEAEAARVRATEVAIDNQEAHRNGIDIDRQEDREGGMRFFIPGFARDDEHTILLRLRVPAGAAGQPLTLAAVELRYKDRVLGANGGDERQVAATYASSAIESDATQDVAVRRAVYAFRTGEELVNVSALLAQGAQQEALETLWERVEVLRSAGERLGDAGLRQDAERLDGMRQAVLSRSLGSDLMTGSMLQRAGNAFMR